MGLNMNTDLNYSSPHLGEYCFSGQSDGLNHFSQRKVPAGMRLTSLLGVGKFDHREVLAHQVGVETTIPQPIAIAN